MNIEGSNCVSLVYSFPKGSTISDSKSSYKNLKGGQGGVYSVLGVPLIESALNIKNCKFQNIEAESGAVAFIADRASLYSESNTIEDIKVTNNGGVFFIVQRSFFAGSVILSSKSDTFRRIEASGERSEGGILFLSNSQCKATF